MEATRWLAEPKGTTYFPHERVYFLFCYAQPKKKIGKSSNLFRLKKTLP
jgi:hypothetical protein